ncbi:two-component system KDP operon response regulator KdpE [Kitasatospora sp. MAP12-15]|uniref:response regulator n=1 Tax=unclassified Kitasatospora TaxID=2633591 RepID=UPI002475F2A7|nr:response regulator [Kitasatospora sp. MAP12-44]MDH6111075.1 two-component system KDP operon response regulator KdpE [Kitasatospora sp. MAP12-44]
MTHILVVDDEPQLLRALRINLRARKYEVATAETGGGALEAAEQSRPDAVLLDLGLPDLDGVEVIHRLRSRHPAPIIVLSGRSGADDKIQALDAGADDYVTKPFLMDELFARLRAVLRRPVGTEPTAQVVIGEHVVDLVACTVLRADGAAGQVRLTPTEWRILSMLLANPGRLLPGRQILRAVWGPEHEHRGNYLRVYLAGLRRKLERDPARPRHLLTEPGIGYRYEP